MGGYRLHIDFHDILKNFSICFIYFLYHLREMKYSYSSLRLWRFLTIRSSVLDPFFGNLATSKFHEIALAYIFSAHKNARKITKVVRSLGFIYDLNH